MEKRREHVRRFDINQDDCENKKCASTQTLQMQKCQLIELQELLERYWEVLPVFSFNSAKYDLIVLKSYFLPILVNERDIGPTLIKKENQFTSFKLGDIQLLDILNFLGGTTILESFLKACNTSETKFFPLPTNGLMTRQCAVYITSSL